MSTSQDIEEKILSKVVNVVYQFHVIDQLMIERKEIFLDFAEH